MKRSEINKAITAAKDILYRNHFNIPFFAFLDPCGIRETRQKYTYIIDNKLGWDVTDFGGGDFDSFGAVLFTLRNGTEGHIKTGTPYAEKVIILRPGQRLPLHFHYMKTEDIINRGGGILVMELYRSLGGGGVDHERDVEVFCDGDLRILRPGELVEIMPGGSITLKPGLYHRFWAHREGGDLVCGEVSTVNDDLNDNCFAEPVKRFADITEDEKPVHLLCSDY